MKAAPRGGQEVSGEGDGGRGRGLEVWRRWDGLNRAGAICRGDVAVATTAASAAATVPPHSAPPACRATTLSAVWRRSAVVSGRASDDVGEARASHVLSAHMALGTARTRAEGCVRRRT